MVAVSINPVHVGSYVITQLEIDLIHVNFGLDSTTRQYRTSPRSNHSSAEIVQAFEALDCRNLLPEKMLGDYLYFGEIIQIPDKKRVFICFCIHKFYLNTAGVITLYQID